MPKNLKDRNENPNGKRSRLLAVAIAVEGLSGFYKADIADSATETTWSRFHDAAEPMHCAVAEVDGRLIGMVHYIQHRSCWARGDYLYLQDLFVDPDIRGKGVGRALIQHVYAAAAELGASRVYPSIGRNDWTLATFSNCLVEIVSVQPTLQHQVPKLVLQT